MAWAPSEHIQQFASATCERKTSHLCSLMIGMIRNAQLLFRFWFFYVSIRAIMVSTILATFTDFYWFLRIFTYFYAFLRSFMHMYIMQRVLIFFMLIHHQLKKIVWNLTCHSCDCLKLVLTRSRMQGNCIAWWLPLGLKKVVGFRAAQTLVNQQLVWVFQELCRQHIKTVWFDGFWYNPFEKNVQCHSV